MLDHTRSGHNSGEVKATLHSGPNEVAEVEPDVLLEDLLQSALDTTKQDPEAAAAGNFGRGSGKGVKDDEDGLDLPEVFQFPGEKARTLPERWRFPSGDDTLRSDKRTDEEEEGAATVSPVEVFLEVPKDFRPILQAIDTDNKDKVKLAKAGGGQKAAKLEGHKAIATVIKHKDRKGQGVAQTVLIPNSPEAHKAFGIKNVPRQFFDQMEKLIESGARPLFAKPKIEKTQELGDEEEVVVTTQLPNSDEDGEDLTGKATASVVTPPIQTIIVKTTPADLVRLGVTTARGLPRELLPHLVEQSRGAKASDLSLAAVANSFPDDNNEDAVSSSAHVGNDIVSEVYDSVTTSTLAADVNSGSRVFFMPEAVAGSKSARLLVGGPTVSNPNYAGGQGGSSVIQFRGENNIAPPLGLAQYNGQQQQEELQQSAGQPLEDLGAAAPVIDFYTASNLESYQAGSGLQALSPLKNQPASSDFSASSPQGGDLSRGLTATFPQAQDGPITTTITSQITGFNTGFSLGQNSAGTGQISIGNTGIQSSYISGQNSFGSDQTLSDQTSISPGTATGIVNTYSSSQDTGIQNSYSSNQDTGIQNSFSSNQDTMVQNSYSSSQDTGVQNSYSSNQDTGIQNSYSSSQDTGIQSSFSSGQNNGVLNSYNSGQNTGILNSFNSQESFSSSGSSSLSSAGDVTYNPNLPASTAGEAAPSPKSRPAPALWQQTTTVIRKPEAIKAQEFARPDNPLPQQLSSSSSAAEAIYKGLSTFQRQQSTSSSGTDNSHLFTNPPMTFQTASGRFLPPSTLLFGFKPMTPTPASSLADARRPAGDTDGSFSPPPKLNYGFKPAGVASAAVYNQVSDEATRKGKSSAATTKAASAVSRPKSSANNYSIIDQISDFLEPFTKPWASLFQST